MELEKPTNRADLEATFKKDRDLSDRSSLAFHAAGTFVDGRKVGVEVSGVSSSPGNFFSRRTDLSKSVAVVCHVVEYNEKRKIESLIQSIGPETLVVIAPKKKN